MKSVFRQLVMAGTLLAAVMTGASAQVLYDTNSWEATGGPITWVIGPVVPQNFWRDLDGNNVEPNHLITAATVLGTQTITPKTGSQMHRGITSTATVQDTRYAWPDMSEASAAGVGYFNRTAGNNTVMVNYDIFLPSADMASTHMHGIRSWNVSGTLLGGSLFRNSDRAQLLTGGGGITIGPDTFGGVFIPGSFDRDEWFHVETILDYEANRVESYINGVQTVFILSGEGVYRTGWPLSGGTALAFGDADLEARNVPTQPVASNAFTDNFIVSAARSITFTGTVELEGVDSTAGPAFLFNYAIALLNADNTTRGRVVLPLFTPDAVEKNKSTFSVRFHNVPDGDYKLYIKPFNNLSRVISVTVAGSGTVTVPDRVYLAGDIDGNDIVDIEDLNLFIQAFDAVLDEDPGTAGNQSSANWDARADLNYNGFVDVEDLSLFIQNFDSAGEGEGIELVP